MAELTKERFKKVESDRFDKDVISRPTISYWGDAWRRLKKNPVAMFSLALLVACVIMTIIGPYIRGLDFISVNGTLKTRDRLRSSGLALTIWAAICFQESGWEPVYRSFVALVCTAIQIVVGCIYGGIMAYYGGIVDEV
mgnify:CR=1 FL=1